MLSNKYFLISIKFFIVIALLLPWIGTEYSYLTLLAIVYFSIFTSKSQAPKSVHGKVLYALPFLIFASWLYGVAVGLINGVPLPHVFSNFLGLSFYLIFYALNRVGLDNKSIVQTVFYAALIVLVYDGYLLISGFIEGGVFSIVANSISDYRVKYDPAVLYFSPFILSSMIVAFGSSRLSNANKILSSEMKNSLLMFFFSSVFILLTMSKGVILVFMIFLLFSFGFGIYNIVIYFKITKEFLIFLIISFALLIKFFEIVLFVLDSFGGLEDSNAVRDLQSTYIINEISFVGAGLGAPLRSGYFRSEDAPYGFELTYLNLMHKLGFASVFLFLSYFLVIFEAFKSLFYREKFWVGIFVLGLMSYLLVGYGNPILISPNFVLIHILSIIILMNNSNKIN